MLKKSTFAGYLSLFISLVISTAGCRNHTAHVPLTPPQNIIADTTQAPRTETDNAADTRETVEENTQAPAAPDGDDNNRVFIPLPNGDDAAPSDEALFQDLLDNHWSRIFPNGRRNVGGPQFFKYIYERLATNHDLFQRYSRFYCGVSGAIVRPGPNDNSRFDTVKIKDSNGRCVVGSYYRCCWPCVCDIMKHAQVEEVDLKLPLDETDSIQTYWVLTIGDPCHRCTQSPCSDLPPEVSTYQCRDGITANGLRVHNRQLTDGPNGRLVFALLHDAARGTETERTVSDELLTRCAPRINATPSELKEMGGMGNIFVDVALINTADTPSNSFDDLCD